MYKRDALLSRDAAGYRQLSVQDDSQGKLRAGIFTRRTALLALALIIGATLGIVMSQRIYVESNRTDLASLGRRTQAATDAMRSSAPTVSSKQAVQSHHSAAPQPTRPGCKAVQGNCELEAYLKQVAPDGEVLVAISNFNLVQWGGMLNTWIERVQKAGVKPWLVLAIDEPLHKYLDEKSIPNFLIKQEIARVQQGTGSNHAVSALKFGILAEFLKLGWSVLLSDVDIVTLDDPFKHLYRDRDIEGMTDGFDDATAYGFIDGLDDPSMGWARYAQATKHMNLNSGLFYARAGPNTVALMQRLADRLSRQKYWDQTAFNEEIFFLSHGDVSYVPISVRVMDIWRFQNSKVFFKQWRHLDAAKRPKPVMVHVNYHPEKGERMKSIVEYFDSGDAAAIMKWPGGSEKGS